MLTFEQYREKSRNGETVLPQVATVGNKFCCVGTLYGHIHTTGGDLRTWQSYSGARRFLTKYLEVHKC
jgi:hypothetical protein